jgi:hypothetical protein
MPKFRVREVEGWSAPSPVQILRGGGSTSYRFSHLESPEVNLDVDRLLSAGASEEVSGGTNLLDPQPSPPQCMNAPPPFSSLRRPSLRSPQMPYLWNFMVAGRSYRISAITSAEAAWNSLEKGGGWRKKGREER